MEIFWHLVCSVLLACGALPAGAMAQKPADDVPVPGGPGAIRRLLGLDPTRPPETFFLDLHEALLAGSGWNARWSQIDRRRAVVDFSEDLAAFRKQFGRSLTISLSGVADRDRASKLLSWLGVDVDRKGGEISTEIRDEVRAVRRRAFFDAVVGIPVPVLLTRLRAGEALKVEVNDGTAPLPFGLDTWRELLDLPRLSASEAFLELVKNVSGSRLLVTMHALDAETREGLRAIARSGRGSVLRDGDVLDGLARFPGALALSGGELVLPGGRDADPIWLDLFGVSPSRPAAFLRALYEKDSGRGAYVVEVLQQLPAPVTRALLFGAAGGGAGAVARMRKLYRSIEEARRSVGVSRRDPYDFAHLARFLRAGPSGGVTLLPVDLDGETFPKSEAELEAIVSRTNHREEPEDTLARLLKGEVGAGAGADAARAARRFLIVSSLVEGRPALEDRGVVALLLRGADRFASAYAILEDSPFQEPALARRYLFAVDRLDRRKPSREAEAASALFQAGCEILADVYRAGSLDAAMARKLFSAFLDLPLFVRSDLSPAKGERDVHQWLTAKLLPACEKWAASQPPVAPTTSDEAPEEHAADEVLARALVGTPPAAAFEWNGGHYRFEPASDELKRRREFREKQRLASLEDLTAIRRERDVLTGALVRGDRTAVRETSEALLDLLGLSESGGTAFSGEDERVLEECDRAREALDRVAKAPRALTAAQAEKDLSPVDAVVAERLLEALLGHLYAAAAGDPEDLYYEDPDFVRRHSFRTVEKGGRTVESAFSPTALSSETTGGGARVTGSLFGLADVLGLLHADQITYSPGAAIANENIRSGLIGPVRRMSPARLDDDALRFVAASCRTTEEFAAALGGRERGERFRVWRELARDLVPRARLAALAELGGEGISSESLSRFLSPSDLYRIGRRIANGALPESAPEAAAVAKQALAALESRLGPSGARERLAEFGPRAVAWAGRMRLTDLDLPPYESLAAYRAPQLFADRLYDWKIAVARVVAEAGLPAAVLPLVLPQAVDEMMGDLRMAFAYDWSAIVRRSSAFGATDLGRLIDENLQSGRLLRDHAQDTDAASP
jgi:hypothetical protein